jgi:hypothetical protein
LPRQVAQSEDFDAVAEAFSVFDGLLDSEEELFESESDFDVDFDESSFEYFPVPSPASLSSRERLRVP